MGGPTSQCVNAFSLWRFEFSSKEWEMPILEADSLPVTEGSEIYFPVFDLLFCCSIWYVQAWNDCSSIDCENEPHLLVPIKKWIKGMGSKGLPLNLCFHSHPHPAFGGSSMLSHQGSVGRMSSLPLRAPQRLQLPLPPLCYSIF